MKRYITLLAAVTLAVTLIIPTVMADERKDNSGAAIARNLDIFNSIYKELNTFYVDTIDAQKSIETAINAMLDDIDPYTEYIPAKSQDDFLVISTGQYDGIGSYIQQRTTARRVSTSAAPTRTVRQPRLVCAQATASQPSMVSMSPDGRATASAATSRVRPTPR